MTTKKRRDRKRFRMCALEACGKTWLVPSRTESMWLACLVLWTRIWGRIEDANATPIGVDELRSLSRLHNGQLLTMQRARQLLIDEGILYETPDGVIPRDPLWWAYKDMP